MTYEIIDCGASRKDLQKTLDWIAINRKNSRVISVIPNAGGKIFNAISSGGVYEFLIVIEKSRGI